MRKILLLRPRNHKTTPTAREPKIPPLPASCRINVLGINIPVGVSTLYDNAQKNHPTL